MIEVSRVRKQFGPVVAVEDVSFTVAPGQILGLLGPNGAGKTTTLRLIYGMVSPTSGSVKVAGRNVAEHTLAVQRQLGVLPDAGGLYKRLTARENIAYFGTLHGMTARDIAARTAVFIDLLHMHDIIDRKTKGFSQGERMKVCLARALVHNPDYLLLDEPTNGLDVLTTRAVRRLLQHLKSEGKAIVFSSHLMHEVEQLCDQLVIVAHGRVAHKGTVAETVNAAGKASLEDAFVQFAYEEKADV